MNEENTDNGAATPDLGALSAPVIPSGDDGSFTPEEKQEVDEWEEAAADVFADNGVKKEEENNESTKSGEKPKTAETPKTGEEGKKPPEAGAEDGEKSGEQEEEKVEPVAPTDAYARISQREAAQQLEAIKSDVKEKMFKDVPTELRDKDGDLITGPRDIMKLINPATQEPFTEEEAEAYYNQANARLEKDVANMERQVTQIAEVSAGIKDEADIINYDYGELLRAMPGLRAQIWEQYNATLKKDPKTGIIIEAPVSLEKLYRTALEPYAALGRRLEAEEASKTTTTDDKKTPANPLAAPAETKKANEEAKLKRRQDRSDIYGPGKVDTETEDDKEWGAAAQAVFGEQLKK